MNNTMQPQELSKGDCFTPTFSNQVIKCLGDYDQERKGILVLLDGFATWLTFEGCQEVVWVSSADQVSNQEVNIFSLEGGDAEVEDELYDAIQDIDEGALETCYFGRNSDQAYRELLAKELGWFLMAKAHRCEIDPVRCALYITRENLKRAGVSI